MEYCAPNGWLLTAMFLSIMLTGVAVGILGNLLYDICRARKQRKREELVRWMRSRIKGTSNG